MNIAERVRSIVHQVPFLNDWRFHGVLTAVGGGVGILVSQPLVSLLSTLPQTAQGALIGSGVFALFYTFRELGQMSRGEGMSLDKILDAGVPITVSVVITILATLG